MAGLVPAIHVFSAEPHKDVDARHKAGHDGNKFKYPESDQTGFNSSRIPS
jgi:hypothetical protein